MNNPINSAANSIGPAGGAHHQSAGSGAAPSTGAPLQLGASCLFSRLASAMSDPLVAAHQLIAGVIDPGQVPEGMCVHYGVSQELDDMKALYFGLPDLLKEVEMYEVGRLPRSLAAAATGTWSVAYLPQLGFMLQIDTGLLKEDVLECLPDAELAFEGGVLDGEQVGACYHTATTRDLSERYGDVLLKIRDMETAVCNEVARRLGAHGGALRAAVATAAELDCLLSLAEAAVELRLSRPQLTSDNVLRIVGGRHILCQEIVPAGAEFIPNDTTMERDAARVHVITGPNFSGKSVYAKQVAIIVFLAHVGSFVPAEAAEVGLTDRIFTRVGTKECGAVPQSAFMIDLSQVAAMLRLATPRSLLIIDEFGKGTLASDGVGLLCGALGHLAARREPPKVILATHFSEVLDQQYLPRNPHLAFYTMAVLLHKEGEASDAWQWAGRGGGGSTTRSGLTFLYRLCQGQVGPSFGVECAKLAGVDGDVLKRAQHIIACAEAGRQVTRTSFRGMGARSAAFEGALAALLRVDASSIEDVRGLLGLVQAAMVQ